MDKASVDKRVLLTICGGALMMAGGLYYYLKSNQKHVPSNLLPRDLVLKILKKFKRNYYPIYKYLWLMSTRVTAGYRQRFGRVPEQIKKSLKISLVDANPDFHKLISKMEDEIFAEFDINDKKLFEKTVNHYQKTDKEIREIMNKIQDDVAKACSGVKVVDKVPLPDFVTKEKIIEMYKTMIYEILIMLNDFLTDYVSKHQFINPTDEGFNKELESVLKTEPIRKRILTQHKFDYSEKYHENLIYASAMKQFSESDPEFKKISNQLDDMNNLLLKEHLIPGQNYAELRNQIEQILIIGIENTQPLIDIVPNARAILDKKTKEEQRLRDLKNKEKSKNEDVSSGKNDAAEPAKEVKDEDVEAPAEESKVEDVEPVEEAKDVAEAPAEDVKENVEKTDETTESKEPLEEASENKEEEAKVEDSEKNDKEEVQESENRDVEENA
jgi:hypothetical protein